MARGSVGKTLACVALAGLLFIPSILLGVRWLFAVGAFFDWLPVFTGWMMFGGSRALARLHAGVTLVAYLFGGVWLFTRWVGHGLAFLELWFVAVILGVVAALRG
ncbi:MAG: hypothetical protein GXO32_05860 [Crenarchaeota archaeon]|nr:hypothetical protein [Thermoproteota archaeon]